MRTSDPTEPERFKGLGEKVTPVVQPKPEWSAKPGSPGIEQNAKGELRTVDKLPPFPWGRLTP